MSRRDPYLSAALVCLIGAILVALWCATDQRPPDSPDRLEYAIPE